MVAGCYRRIMKTNTFVVVIDDSTCGQPWFWKQDTGTNDDCYSVTAIVHSGSFYPPEHKLSVWIIDLVRGIIERKQRFLKPTPVISKFAVAPRLTRLCRWLK